MLPEDQQIKYKYRVVRQNSAEKQSVRTMFENSLKMPVEIWERPVSETTAEEELSGAGRTGSFENEAQMLTIVRHEFILRVYDYCSKIASHYLATEVTGGNNLEELHREKPEIFTTGNALKWSRQLIAALGYLHSQSPTLIHGDIKPENILLTSDAKIKLLPFGISPRSLAKINSRTPHFGTTELNYSPLEQIWSSLDSASQKTLLRNYDEVSEQILRRPPDEQSDIYALGATLYYLFTHRPPIDALERSIDLLEGKKDPLAAASALNSEIPAELSDLLMKAMALKREDRFASLSLMLNAFDEISAKIQSASGKVKIASATAHTAPAISALHNSAQSKPLNSQNSEITVIEKKKPEAPTTKPENFSAEIQREKIPANFREDKKTASPAPPKIIEELLPEKPDEQEITPILNSKYHSLEADLSDEAEDIEKERVKTEPVVAGSRNSAEVFENVFAEPPKSGSKRIAAVAFVLILLVGGAALAVWKTGILNPAAAQQTVSAEEKPSPVSLPNDLPTVQNEVQTTGEPVTPPAVEKTGAEMEKTEPTPPKAETARESVGVGAYRNKTAPLQPGKQIAAPAKAPVEKKKSVTVDDLINDN